MLHIIATPIGNLEDITLRALKILERADFILAEDTRRAGLLLKHYNLPKKSFLSFHEHNETKRLKRVIKLLKENKKVVLISNAGTPCICDPGYKLVRKCYEQGIKIVVTPGPSAVINALVLSGLPTDSFMFLGFLSRKKGARIKKLELLKEINTTLVIFESPFRVEKLLIDLKDTFGAVKCAVIREMTKVYEEVKSGSIEELLEYFRGRKIKGEVTIVLDNRK